MPAGRAIGGLAIDFDEIQCASVSAPEPATGGMRLRA
jgi:hypothetical protein